ncbi:MAG: tyrosine-type recombinase/integrase [Acutalibacter sp.]|uniref:tyrosine-type recombinase/integrase n=1 Tax=Acutalibacter sp. TaxID=1918636 RepID=UPI00216D1750|nr:tyrosine-type recombinase/integrase [Acutalibacter sp.]MCI9226029.1 tyrosine-type recombinase/integrase [Acutalibacter sp.]
MNTEFLSHLRGMGKSPKTVAGYCRDVEQYLSWCEETFGERTKLLYRANVLEYISYMRNIKGYSPKTVNHHLSSLRSYNDWLIESGQQTDTVILKNDFMKIQLQYASPSTVTKKDVEAFRQRLLESGSKRDYAIVTLFAYSGIRRSECANLKLNQVDLTAREIRVIGKGDKQRLVYINDKIVYALREYLKERNSDSPYFFVSRQSEKLTTSRINQIFNRYSDVITPKSLRHFFCSNALENGYSIHEVANQAGHSNVQTTLIYANPTAQAMKDKANKL